MADKCKVCLGSDVKEELLLKFPHLKAALEDIPECDDAGELVICQGKKGKAKREPSKYNLFMGTCMKSGDKPKDREERNQKMKSCAIDWKKSKGA